jgi:integral membrane protein (TIGR01906 family)
VSPPRDPAPSGLVRFGARLATILCVIAVPLALLSGSVRAVALDRGFYLVEFDRYGIGATTGLSRGEQRAVAEAFVAYFQDEPGRMDVRVARGNAVEPLFEERELAHMEDVQALMHLVFRVQVLALMHLGGYIAGGLVLRGRAFLPVAGRVLIAGGTLAAGVLISLGLLALVDFANLFLQFHLISFTNDLWLLDPRRHNLIRLFPQEFFLDAAMRVVALTVVQALAVASLGLALIWLTRSSAVVQTGGSSR